MDYRDITFKLNFGNIGKKYGNKMLYDDKLELDSLIAEMNEFYYSFSQWEIHSATLQETSKQLLENLRNCNFSKVLICSKFSFISKLFFLQYK